MRPAAFASRRNSGRHLRVMRRIVVEDALAGVADHCSLTRTNIVVGLWTKQNLTTHAFLVAHFGEAGAAMLGYAVVVLQHVRIYAGARRIALRIPLSQLFF